MLVQKVGIVNSIIKKLKKRAYPVSTRLPIKTICFSELIQVIHTTHVPIVNQQQWRDRLKPQGSIKLHTYYTSFHGLWEDIANKRNCFAILKNIVAHLSYLLTGIATFDPLRFSGKPLEICLMVPATSILFLVRSSTRGPLVKKLSRASTPSKDNS